MGRDGVTWHAEFMKQLCINTWIWSKHSSSWQSGALKGEQDALEHECPGAQLLPHIWDYSRQGSYTSSPVPEDREFTVKKLLFHYIQKHARIYYCGILFCTNTSWWQLVVVKAQQHFAFSDCKSLFFSGQAPTQGSENHLYKQNCWFPPCRCSNLEGWDSQQSCVPGAHR